MYWVVTTVVSETKADLRAKIIKQYIKIASELSPTVVQFVGH